MAEMIHLSQTPMRKVSPEEELLFACTRQHFPDTHRQAVSDICRSEAIDWNVVYATAKLHGVAPLVYANLQQRLPPDLGLPPNVVNRFRKLVVYNTLLKDNMAKGLIEALSFFAGRSIDVMLIKGGALDVLVYDQPYYTTQADIDLVLSARREEITDHEFSVFGEYFHGTGLEYDFFEHHDVTMNGVLPVNFQKIWADAVKIKFGGQAVYVMAPEDMLISLCINSCRKRFFRLKALCDIAETINKYPDLKWSELIHKARAYDCHTIVYTALAVTKATLGCEMPDEVLDNLKINPLRAKILRHLSHGMSLSSFSSLYSDQGDLFGRKVDWALLLPYATFRWYQIWRRFKFVIFFTENGEIRHRAI